MNALGSPEDAVDRSPSGASPLAPDPAGPETALQEDDAMGTLGGAREGAGRPSIGATVRKAVSLTPHDVAVLQAYAEAYEVPRSKGGGTRPLNASEAIRRLIQEHAARSLRAMGLAVPEEA